MSLDSLEYDQGNDTCGGGRGRSDRAHHMLHAAIRESALGPSQCVMGPDVLAWLRTMLARKPAEAEESARAHVIRAEDSVSRRTQRRAWLAESSGIRP